MKAIVFIILVVMTFSFTKKILMKKSNQTNLWEAFYNLPKNELDILFLGSSHSYYSYNPKIIFHKTNLNTFNLSTASQQIDQLYYNLKETLKYQKPQYVFVDLFTLRKGVKDWKHWKVYNNLDGQKFSLNKIQAVLDYSAKGDRINSLFPIMRYHNNWSSSKIIKENIDIFFSDYENKNKLTNDGYIDMPESMTNEMVSIYHRMKLNKYKNFENYYGLENFKRNKIYLKKIKELSLKHKFKIIYVYSPMYADIINDNYINKHTVLKNLAFEYADDFIDFNMLSKKLKMTPKWFANENAQDSQHTSKYGANRLSDYIANYLIENKIKNKKNSDFWKKRQISLEN